MEEHKAKLVSLKRSICNHFQLCLHYIHSKRCLLDRSTYLERKCITLNMNKIISIINSWLLSGSRLFIIWKVFNKIWRPLFIIIIFLQFNAMCCVVSNAHSKCLVIKSINLNFSRVTPKLISWGSSVRMVEFIAASVALIHSLTNKFHYFFWLSKGTI